MPTSTDNKMSNIAIDKCISQASREKMREACALLVAPSKGILAADESSGTIAKRFAQIEFASTEESRCSYRELLFSSPEVEKYLSGVILHEETAFQKSADGSRFVDTLRARGILVGVKVDGGLQTYDNEAQSVGLEQGESVTKGLEQLDEKFSRYEKSDLDVRFAKWRAVFTISEVKPSAGCVRKNLQLLSLYALSCQKFGVVPIVEPEVLMEGTHTIEKCFEVTTQILTHLFAEMRKTGIDLHGVLLKPNMVIAGKSCSQQASKSKIAAMTLNCLQISVPAEVQGIVFLSGGQSEEEATENLKEINSKGEMPWQLSFSYGRALQTSTLKAWRGEGKNVAKAQQVFLQRCKATSEARVGATRV